MKFYQLDNGQAFRFQNISYTKVSPVLASCVETGAQKFMRRADVVEPVIESHANTQSNDGKTFQKTVVLKLIDQSFNTTISQLSSMSLDESARAPLIETIDQLKAHLKNEINQLVTHGRHAKYNKNR